MKRSGILNQALSEAVASIGHGDIMMIVDAGFPIPRSAWRIDLSISPGVPALETIYAAIAPELHVEKVMFAKQVAAHNHPLYRSICKWFDQRDFAPVDYEDTIGWLPQKAKVFIRSGALDPWGNLALQGGVDYQAYFSNPEIGVPEHYQRLKDRPVFIPGKGIQD